MPVATRPARTRSAVLVLLLSQVILLISAMAPPVVAAATGDVTTVAGGVGFGQALNVAQSPGAVAIIGSNLYVSDGSWRAVRKIDLTTGAETTFAGNGFFEHGGDGGPATSASFASVAGLAVSPGGDVHVVDIQAARVRRIDTATGVISTVAGTGSFGSSGDGGPATSAAIAPMDIAFDAAGNLFISQPLTNQVRRVDAATGVITTYAGTGATGFSGDGGPATDATFNGLTGLALDASGNLYVGDTSNQRVRRIDAATGIITTVAGNGEAGHPELLGDGGPATDAEIWIPQAVSIGPDGDLYIADVGNTRIRRVDVATGVINTVAGGGHDGIPPQDEGDGGPATSAEFHILADVAVASNGDFYVADVATHNVRRVTEATGIIDQVAGNDTAVYGGDGGPALGAQILYPADVAFGPDGTMYIPDGNVPRVRAVSPADVTSTFAGNGTFGHSGDGGPASAASLAGAQSVVVNAAGDVFIADGLSRIRRVNTSGTITTYAGGANQAYSGDGGSAASAELNTPYDLALGPDGDLWIADLNNHAIRRIDAATGTITTAAGNGTRGFSGDGGPATSAQLNNPRGITVDPAGNLYIADSFNNRVRRVDAVTGVISTVAGDGSSSFSGDGGPATAAGLGFPAAVVFDAAGNLYLSDEWRIRFVDAATDEITTISGATYGFSGDGGPAIDANFGYLGGLEIGPDDDLYIADNENYRVRRVDLDTTPPPTGADLRITKAKADSSFGISGNHVRYLITVANDGPTSAADVVVTDTLPANTVFASAAPSQGSCGLTAGVVTCQLGALANGASATINLAITPTRSMNLSNTASVTSTTSDPDAADNSSTVAVTVFGPTCTIIGTQGPERLTGGTPNDVICGLGGSDLLDALGGSDFLFGGEGNDVLLAGAGVDQLYGGPGNDNLQGGADFDYGDFAWSSVSTTASLTSGSAIGEGTDSLTGLEGLIGSVFGDTLVGDGFVNVVEPNEGDDSLDGAGGVDIVSYGFSTAPVNVNLGLASNQATGPDTGTDQITRFESIYGSPAGDSLVGDGQVNLINGGAGDDFIDGAGNVDTVTYEFASGSVNVNLALAADQVTGADGTDDLARIEVVRGSHFADVMAAGTSSANFFGLDGNDSLSGAGGGDTLNGGSGADALNGGDLADHLRGGPGNDTITGAAGGDWVYYDDAPAAVNVDFTRATNQATGGAGTDQLASVESIWGSSFGDTLAVDANNNFIIGGTGNDTITGRGGTDMVGYPALGSVSVNLAAASNQATGADGTDQIASVEDIFGSTHNDQLRGNAGPNLIIGSDGNDLIVGNDGNDSLHGQLGDDNLQGGAGTDVADFGFAVAAVTVNLAAANNHATGGAGTDQVTTVEIVWGTDFNDTITGNTADNGLFGRDGNDTINGGGGDDALGGGLGNDTLNGGSGTNDIAYYAAAEGPITANLTLAVEVSGSENNDDLVNVEIIWGSAFADTMLGNTAVNVFVGDGGADVMRGGAGNDQMFGGLGNDRLEGEAGNDNLWGQEGVDTILGGANDDFLNGGPGNDILNGGVGSDTCQAGGGTDSMTSC